MSAILRRYAPKEGRQKMVLLPAERQGGGPPEGFQPK
jgi:hypothetical protein